MQEEPNRPGVTALTVWIIWGALTGSIVLYLFVLQVVGGQDTDHAKGFDSMPLVLGCVAAVNLGVAFFLRLRLGRPDCNDSRQLRKSLTVSIISWALAEAVAIYGFLLGLWGFPARIHGGFFLAGFFAMVMLAPTFLKKRTQ